jgi:O-antigen/teichoic acid export membrane protein
MLQKIENTIAKKYNFDFKYLFRGSFWLLLGHLFSILAILGTSYTFANYLDPQLYGNYRYLISAALILSFFSLTGLSTAVTQAGAMDLKGFYMKGVKTSLAYGLFITLLSTLAAIYYLINDNQILGFGFLGIAIIQPLINTFGLVFSHLIGIKAFKQNTHLHIFKTIFTTATIVAVTLTTSDIILIFITFLLSNCFANLIAFWVKKPSRSIESENEKAEEKMLTYAKHTSIQNIFIGITNQLDKILVFQFLGAVELAVYAFATALPDQYKGITKTIDMLLLPRFSKYSSETIKKGVLRKSILYFMFLCFFATVYIFAAPYIFQLLYPTYTESIILSQIYVLGIIFGIGTIPFSAMKANMDNKALYNYKLGIAVFQVVSLLILLPLFGLIGAVCARIIQRAFVCGYGYYLYFNS